MKTKNVAFSHLLARVACAGAILLMASSASAQNLFVSNFPLGNVYEYTPPSTTSTLYATGLDYPYGIAFDAAGDLYIANTALDSGDSGYVTEVTRGGVVSTVANNLDPKAIAVNSMGDLFVGDYHGGEIYEFSNGVQTTFASGFNTPMDMTFDSAGDLFIGGGYGNGNGYITEIENNPAKTQISFATGLSFPNELAFNAAGDLFEADNGSGNIYEFSNGVKTVFSTLSGLNGIAFNNQGVLFACGGGNIVEISTNGVQTPFTTESGSPDVLAFQPAPEPSSIALMAASAVVLFGFRRATKRNARKT